MGLCIDAPLASIITPVSIDHTEFLGDTLEKIAAAGLASRLPTTAAGPSSLGYARLAGLLLRPDARATEAAELRWVVRPPWTNERIGDLQQRLATIGSWPPVPRVEAEARLWDATPLEIQRALVRWGADAAQLLDGLLKLDDVVLLDRVGGLYTPPIELWAALAALRPALVPVVDTATLLAEVEAAFRGVSLPDAAEEVGSAIERAGYRRDGDRWVDAARIEPAGKALA